MLAAIGGPRQIQQSDAGNRRTLQVVRTGLHTRDSVVRVMAILKSTASQAPSFRVADPPGTGSVTDHKPVSGQLLIADNPGATHQLQQGRLPLVIKYDAGRAGGEGGLH